MNSSRRVAIELLLITGVVIISYFASEMQVKDLVSWQVVNFTIAHNRFEMMVMDMVILYGARWVVWAIVRLKK